MHIGGYLAGILHYILVPITIIITTTTTTTTTLKNLNEIIFFNSFAIILFTFATWIQYHSHFILYQLKFKKLHLATNIKKTIYSLPTESFFYYICCPHYSAEILLYLSLFILLSNNIAILFLLLWVITNLAIVSNRQYEWYYKNYPSSSIPTHWKRLIPGVW